MPPVNKKTNAIRGGGGSAKKKNLGREKVVINERTKAQTKENGPKKGP